MKGILIAAVATAAVLAAPQPAGAQQPNKDKAMKIFVDQKCTTCHSLEGRGNKKGALDDVGGKLTAAQIKEWIVDPEGTAASTKPAPTRKPPMKKKALSDEEVNTLVAYLATLKG
jgi:mono/diheme cytochrome c family protein